VHHEVGRQPGQLRFEVLGVDLTEYVRGPEGPQPVRGQRRVHGLAGGEVHLVPGLARGDRERDQRVGVPHRGITREQHAHGGEPTRPLVELGHHRPRRSVG
jgi:hypothetical protein